MTHMENKHGCGTTAGYIKHRRALEAACAPCKAAWSAYYRAYRASKRVVGGGK